MAFWPPNPKSQTPETPEVSSAMIGIKIHLFHPDYRFKSLSMHASEAFLEYHPVLIRVTTYIPSKPVVSFIYIANKSNNVFRACLAREFQSSHDPVQVGGSKYSFVRLS